MALGVERGDRVGIWSANRAEWMITQYAAAKAGAILVNINPAYRLRELEYALNQSGVSVLDHGARVSKDGLRRDARSADAGARDDTRRARQLPPNAHQRCGTSCISAPTPSRAARVA